MLDKGPLLVDPLAVVRRCHQEEKAKLEEQENPAQRNNNAPDNESPPRYFAKFYPEPLRLTEWTWKVLSSTLRVAFLVTFMQTPLALHLAFTTRYHWHVVAAVSCGVYVVTSVMPLSLSSVSWEKGNFVIRVVGTLLTPVSKLCKSLAPPITLYNVVFLQHARFFVWMVIVIVTQLGIVVSLHYGEYPRMAAAFAVVHYGIEPGSRAIIAVKLLEHAGVFQFQYQPYRAPAANLLSVCTNSAQLALILCGLLLNSGKLGGHHFVSGAAVASTW